MTKTVWVVSEDGGYEGLREPWMVFEDKETAESVVEALKQLEVPSNLKISATLVWNLGMPAKSPEEFGEAMKAAGEVEDKSDEAQ